MGSPQRREAAPAGASRAELRRERSRGTRRAIVVAAAQRFAVLGYHGTALSEVLAGAGVTKGALYFHFPDKQALADAVIAETDAFWTATLGEVVQRGLDPLRTLIVQTEQVVHGVLHDPVARGGTRLLNDTAVATRHGGEHYRFAEAAVATQLHAAAGAGLLRERVDVEVVARSIATLMAGHHLICQRSDTLDGLGSRVAAMWQALLPLIAADDWLADHPTPQP